MSTTTQPLTGDSFHGLTPEKCQRVLDSALDSNLVTRRDYDLIQQFVDEKSGTLDIALSRQRKLISHLTLWQNHIGKNFEDCTFSDLTAGITKLKKATSRSGKPYAPDTIADYIRILKTFFYWMIEEGYSEIPEKKIKKIKSPKTSNSRYTEDDVFTLEQIQAIIKKGCKDLKELTMFTLLYEGALRVGEIGTLTWDKIEFHPTHVNLHVKYKTEFPRQVPIVLHREYIQLWRNMHDPIPGEPVFLNEKGEPFQYPALRKRLREIGERSEIGSTIPPHLVRHTRITHMILEGFSRESVGLICWGQVNAPELNRYAHLFGSVDDLVLQHYGIVRADTRTGGLQMIQCPECGYVNPPGKMYCSSCNTPLTDHATSELNRFRTEMPPERIMQIITAYIEKQNNVAASQCLLQHGAATQY